MRRLVSAAVKTSVGVNLSLTTSSIGPYIIGHGAEKAETNMQHVVLSLISGCGTAMGVMGKPDLQSIMQG